MFGYRQLHFDASSLDSQVAGEVLRDSDCVVNVLLMNACGLMDNHVKEHFRILCKAVRRNTSLHTLAIANNSIDNWGARELALALQVATKGPHLSDHSRLVLHHRTI